MKSLVMTAVAAACCVALAQEPAGAPEGGRPNGPQIGERRGPGPRHGGMMPGGMGGMPDLSKMDPKQLEALQKQAQAAGLGNGLPKGLPGMPGGGLPSLPGGLKLPGLPGGPKKK